MAKIIRKIPKRKNGKYVETGLKAEEILSKKYTVDDVLDSETKTKLLNLNYEEQQELIKLIQDLATRLNFLSCIKVSFYNLNGLNVFQNAQKKGLIEEFTKEQIDILKNISKNTSLARILMATGKYSSYILLIVAICNFYINTHYKLLYNMIQPEETYVFLVVCSIILTSMIGQKLIANRVYKKVTQMISLNTR